LRGLPDHRRKLVKAQTTEITFGLTSESLHASMLREALPEHVAFV
jgi:hypothetical protein